MIKNTTWKIVIAGVMAALVFVVTVFTKIPAPLGSAYYHAGDSIIFLCAMLLGGPLGGIISGIGSAIADLFLGYTFYIPATLIIKGLMGWMAGMIMAGSIKSSWLKRIIAVLAAALWMAVGYYVFEVFIIKTYEWRAALTGFFFNLAQTGVGAVIFMVLAMPVEKAIKAIDIK